ncbi:hypothetical protein GCM10009634_79260 [Saccharothrix xinjiangensis]
MLLAGCTADPAGPATAEVAAPPTALTVLDVGDGEASAIATSAELFRNAPVAARAAGARVVTVRGADPRADRAAVEALRGDPPTTVPAFEVIATVAQVSPGPDGDYSGEAPVESLRPWVEAAGREGLYVVLDLQPGRARLLDQAKRYASLLELPHVGLAVDPEWKLGPDQVPLEQIGGVDAAEINETAAWPADLTARAALPQELLVVHQFRLSCQ